jgi:shikimate kinase
MAVGRSAVGRTWVGRLRWVFVDLDRVEAAEMRVHEIFSRKGEPYFHQVNERHWQKRYARPGR